MDPEQGNPQRNEKTNDVKKASSEAADPRSAKVDSGALSQPPLPGTSASGSKENGTGINESDLARVSRRELLKLSPILVLGAFAVPSVQESLLKRGLGFSDWVSRQLFRRGHL